MFENLQSAKRRSRAPAYASAAIHVAVIALLLWKPAPQYVKTESVLHGNYGSGHNLTYLAIGGAEKPIKARERDEVEAKKLHIPPNQRPKQAAPQTTTAMASSMTPMSNSTEGTAYGTLTFGAADGHDVRPAYPVVYPDPIVARAICPPHVKGDVIVEVTIDERGNIIGTKLLQGLGFGIDERVVATVQMWRYEPARRDGQPIASQQDVHFHFPS